MLERKYLTTSTNPLAVDNQKDICNNLGIVCGFTTTWEGRKMTGLERITFDPNVMSGKACIRGTRVTVSLVLNLVAQGMIVSEIVEAYPYLEPDDIRQSLQYAAWLADESIQPTEAAALRSISSIWGFPPVPRRIYDNWGTTPSIFPRNASKTSMIKTSSRKPVWKTEFFLPTISISVRSWLPAVLECPAWLFSAYATCIRKMYVATSMS